MLSIDMFLKHPKVKDLRILRVYSKSIETKYYHGPHSSKVAMIIINIIHVDYIIRFTVNHSLIKNVIKTMSSLPYIRKYVVRIVYYQPQY